MRIIWNQKNFNVRYKGTSTIVFIKTLYTLRKKNVWIIVSTHFEKQFQSDWTGSTIIFQVRNFSKRIVTLLCLVKNSRQPKKERVNSRKHSAQRQQKIWGNDHCTRSGPCKDLRSLCKSSCRASNSQCYKYECQLPRFLFQLHFFF